MASTNSVFREQTSHKWPKNALVDRCTAVDKSVPVRSS